MTISKDDEREAREWLERYSVARPAPHRRNVRTILALLDRRVMPAPDEVPYAVLMQMHHAFTTYEGGSAPSMRAAYRALYDHYHQLPEPKMTPREALHAAIADIQWMSAASDFGPQGQAHAGWVKVRDRLNDYEAALKLLEANHD